MTRRLAALFCVVIAAACGDASNPVEPDPDTAGRLVVNLEIPNATDGAVQLTIRGTGITDVTPARPDYIIFTRSIGAAHRVVVFGTIESGALISFRVPDTTRLAAYSIELEEVAAESGMLRSDLDGYRLDAVTAPR